VISGARVLADVELYEILPLHTKSLPVSNEIDDSLLEFSKLIEKVQILRSEAKTDFEKHKYSDCSSKYVFYLSIGLELQ